MVGSKQLLIATRMGGGTDREREEGGELVVTSLKKNLNAPRPSEHPPVRGKKCYCFRCTVYGTSTYRLSWGAGTHF